MKWALVIMIMGQHPIETGMTYSTLGACYTAEDAVAAQVSEYINGWMKERKTPITAGLPDFMEQRAYRGVCVPRQ